MAQSLGASIRQAIKYRKVLLNLSRFFGTLGLRVTPVYLTREFMPQREPPGFSARLAAMECGFLDEAEIRDVFAHPESAGYAKNQAGPGKGGCLCYGLKESGKVMSFAWVDLAECRSPYYSFPLKQNQAYLFDAYTYNENRGLNLAPYLRYRLYRSLAEMGRQEFFSLTEYFNTPAVNFKKKLAAKHLKLGLFVEFFRLFRTEIVLRRYQV